MFSDRAAPVQPMVEAMMQVRDLEAAPIAPQLFGNAGREHMDKYGTKAEHNEKYSTYSSSITSSINVINYKILNTMNNCFIHFYCTFLLTSLSSNFKFKLNPKDRKVKIQMGKVRILTKGLGTQF